MNNHLLEEQDGYSPRGQPYTFDMLRSPSPLLGPRPPPLDFESLEEMEMPPPAMSMAEFHSNELYQLNES